VKRDHQIVPDVDDDEFDEWAEERLSDVEYERNSARRWGKTQSDSRGAK
jgi:hypothetical protein